jgi:hypothetical protein
MAASGTRWPLAYACRKASHAGYVAAVNTVCTMQLCISNVTADRGERSMKGMFLQHVEQKWNPVLQKRTCSNKQTETI